MSIPTNRFDSTLEQANDGRMTYTEKLLGRI